MCVCTVTSEVGPCTQADAHAMFCEGLMGVAPRDHALRWWYAWAIERRESRRRAAARRRSSLGAGGGGAGDSGDVR